MVDLAKLSEDEDAAVQAIRSAVYTVVRTYFPPEPGRSAGLQAFSNVVAERFLSSYYRIGIVGSRKLSLKTVRSVFETLTTAMVLGDQLELVVDEQPDPPEAA